MTIAKKIAVAKAYSVRLAAVRTGKLVESCRFDGDDLETS